MVDTSTLTKLVHELKPRKCVFGSGGWRKRNMVF